MTTTARPLLRIPYTSPLPPGRIIPSTASTLPGAITALAEFLSASWPSSPNYTPFSPLRSSSNAQSTLPPDLLSRKSRTLILIGAGLSVSSGLSDYRGTRGTYTLNQSYRPIYYHEFCASHEMRKRYWARSFLGWPIMERARANRGHEAVGRLGEMGVLGGVVTQNVDSLHPRSLQPIHLHGTLSTLTCLTCHTLYPRATFQSDLASLNPSWTPLLDALLSSSPSPSQKTPPPLKTNPDGDISLPNLHYTTFKYPACPTCLANPDPAVEVHADAADGSLLPTSPAGILKPSVVMFGESIPPGVKLAAEDAVDAAARILVVGSSLATYSAFRLVRRAREQGMRVGVVNVGGVRGEGELYFSSDGEGEGERRKVVEELLETGGGREGVRIDLEAEDVLGGVVELLGGGKI